MYVCMYVCMNTCTLALQGIRLICPKLYLDLSFSKNTILADEYFENSNKNCQKMINFLPSSRQPRYLQQMHHSNLDSQANNPFL